MSAFHAYDIRGIYDTDFNKDTVYRIGYYLPQVLDAKKILIGCDARASSPEIHDALINGLSDAGCEIYDAELSTTPMIYWGTAKFKFDASVMITASHNPAEYNGLKISARNAIPVGYDTGLNKLEELIKHDIGAITKENSSVHEFDFKNNYTEYLKAYSKNISDLTLSIDCSNGMAGLFVRDLFGDTPNYLFEELDGTFPNHEPNPLNEKNLVQLQEDVRKNKSDIGVIFDGDADRVMFVDENGKFIPPDLMIALLGHYFLEEKNLKGKVIQDIRTSKSVAEYLKPMGAEIIIWRVGRAYAANKLREIDGIFGGELAGHYYFRDFYYSDSGMLAAILILNLISRFKREGKSVSDLISNIKKYENSGEINFRIEQKREAMEAVKETLMAVEKAEQFMDFDGYRIEFSDWWFNIRPSNTEPYLRLLVEARNNNLLNEKVNHIKEIIGRFK